MPTLTYCSYTVHTLMSTVHCITLLSKRTPLASPSTGRAGELEARARPAEGEASTVRFNKSALFSLHTSIQYKYSTSIHTVLIVLIQ